MTAKGSLGDVRCTCPNRDTMVGNCPRHGDAARISASQQPEYALWLVARTDGSLPRVLRAVSARGAILARFKDDDDRISWGNVAAWRLGNFPAQYEVTADKDGVVVREIGNPRV